MARTTPACSARTASKPVSTRTADTGCPHLRAGDTATVGTQRPSPGSLTAQNINLENRELASHPRTSFRAFLQVLIFKLMNCENSSLADLRARATDVLYNVIRYCIDIVSDPKAQEDLVSGLKEKELFPDLKFPLQYSNQCCVLLNDENHSYQDVIRVLNKVLPKATPKLATDLTTYVDKFGKSVIQVGQFKDCHKLSDRISALTRISVSK